MPTSIACHPLPGTYIVSYGANVWNADGAFDMNAICEVSRTAVVLEERPINLDWSIKLV